MASCSFLHSQGLALAPVSKQVLSNIGGIGERQEAKENSTWWEAAGLVLTPRSLNTRLSIQPIITIVHFLGVKTDLKVLILRRPHPSWERENKHKTI